MARTYDKIWEAEGLKTGVRCQKDRHLFSLGSQSWYHFAFP
ncbi:MAG: hypothetical protein JSC085_000028 [Candidatus Tokpelaia sp. JSC085]|nr:MAG: hypothetical protein JSC085_000028 [Candidatus Tokpelaia sp. JSC085]